MLSTSSYLINSALLVASVGSVSLAGRAVQLRWLPGWRGPDLILARAVTGISAVMIWCYLLGSVGAFSRWPMSIALILTGPAAHLALKPKANGQGAFGETSGAAALALGIGGLTLLAGWLLHVRWAVRGGLTGTDPLWYHMPFALRFFQTKSLLSVNYAEPLFQTYFYPSSGSVFHALGMVFYDRDFLSPLINLGWLGLGVLAAASIGHRHGAAATAALGSMAVFAAEGVVRGSAGSAMVDTPAAFFFVAACAILLRGLEKDGGGLAVFALSGLSVGLGLAFKLTIAIPIALLFLGVIWIAPTGRRVLSTAAWAVGAFATGAFWFIRNLHETGSPLPLLDLPLFPNAGKGLQADSMLPISHYLGDSDVIFNQLPAAWSKALGPAGIYALAIGVIGTIAVVWKPPSRPWRVVGAVALAAIVGYFFTPGTAAGLPGGPIRGLEMDARFIAPGMILALAVATANLRFLTPLQRNLTAIPLVMFVAIPATRSKWWEAVHPRIPLLAAAVLVLMIFLIGEYWARIGRKSHIAVYGLVLLVAVAGGRTFERAYAHGRERGYAPSLVAPGKVRVGILGEAGTFNQYLNSGMALDNHVQYIGVRGPNGAFRPSVTCRGTRRLVNAGRYDYVITSPNRQIWIKYTFPNIQDDWIASARNAKFVRELPGLAYNQSSTLGPGKVDPFKLYRILGPLDDAGCPPGS